VDDDITGGYLVPLYTKCPFGGLGKVTLYRESLPSDSYWVRLQNRRTDQWFLVPPERVDAWRKELA
jgi:hypothetical protein